MEEPFETAESLQNWLFEDRQVPEAVARDVASTLFLGGHKFPSSLLNISLELLGSLDITGPSRVILFNKLKDLGPQQQQQVR